ncbi:hypothetical protein GF377_09800 [candidate division GN15 bacterium]|nr:hypothetical protein [candidate division GN15 bacterium]
MSKDPSKTTTKAAGGANGNGAAGDSTPIDCYICSLTQKTMEPDLVSRGIGRGMIVFAIPGYGVLFKCRAEGSLIDLEFGAFFALLKFVKESMPKDRIKRLKIHSSSPEFIFTLSNKGPQLRQNKERTDLLKESLAGLTVEVAYVKRLNNRALVPAAEYPSTPTDRRPLIQPSPDDSDKVQFKPLQKGIRL